MTSRERMLAAISGQAVDHVPCCFMSFGVLHKRCQQNMFDQCRAELAMGLDAMLFIPTTPRSQRPEHPDLRGLPVRFGPEVRTREWTGTDAGGEKVLNKEYTTPAGPLTTGVRLSDDWPHGNHIPFLDDFQIPRAIKPLVTQASDLPALRYLLAPPQGPDVAAFRQEAERAHAFAKEQGVLLAGGWGVGVDMAAWLCSLERLIEHMADEPEFAAQLLNEIHAWNLWRMEVVLSAGVDLYIRRGWYEGCDFIPRSFYQRVLFPQLRVEAALAHQHGAKFGYICTSGALPLIEYYLDAGVDVLIGVDPVQGTHTDMSALRAKAGKRMSLWGGVSGAVTVERGSADEVRAAVRKALGQLGKDRLVLSPVDNITVEAPQTWANIEVFIDEWRRQGAGATV